MKYSETLKVSPGFKPAVNIKDDFNNYIKIKNYIPTKHTINVLQDISKSITNEGSRVRHLTGALGTGKSNFGLIVGNYFRNPISMLEDSALTEVMRKVKNSSVEKYNEIIRNRNIISGKFLVVVIEGYYNSVNQALIDGLDKTLKNNEELNFIYPKTVYKTIINLIIEWKQNHIYIYNCLLEEIMKEKYKNISNFLEELENYNEEAYKVFEEIYPKLTGVEKFYCYNGQDAKEIYNDVLKRIYNKGYYGIVVIWDEFGSNLERIVADSDGVDYLQLQKFAESCNQIGKKEQLHLILISHNNITELAARNNTTLNQLENKNSNLSKFQGRFTSTKRFTYDTDEIYYLLTSLFIKDNKFDKAIQKYNDNVLSIIEMSLKFGLFYFFSEAQVEELIKKALPLHPFTLYALVKICDKFAQNERSAFTFISSEEPGGFKEFCNSENLVVSNKINLYLVDRLVDYFYEQIKNSTRTNNINREIVSDYEMALSTSIKLNELDVQIIKTIFIINLVNHVNIAPTIDKIAFILNMTEKVDKEQVANSLEKLCHGEDRKLAYSRSDFSYRFISSKFDIGEKVSRFLEMNTYDSIDYFKLINKYGKELEVKNYFTSSDYRTKNYVTRKFQVILVNTEQLRDITKYTELIETNFLDGIILMILVENHIDIQIACSLAEKVFNKQIIVAIPLKPIKYRHYLNELNALEKIIDPDNLENTDEIKKYKLEKQLYKEELLDLLRIELGDIFNRTEDVIWYHTKKKHRIQDIEEFLCEVLEEVYDKMPKINHKSLVSDEGNDGQKTYRTTILDYLLSNDSIKILLNEDDPPKKMLINSVLKQCDILKDNEISAPRLEINQEAFYVWEEIEKYIINSCDNKYNFRTLIELLKKPPYGLKQRIIPLFIGAVLSKHLDNIYISNPYYLYNGFVIDGRLVEQICEESNICFSYNKLSEQDKQILKCYEQLFINEKRANNVKRSQTLDRLGNILNYISNWWNELPLVAKNIEPQNKEARLFKKNIIKQLERIASDRALFLDYSKEITKFSKIEDLLIVLRQIKNEFDNIYINTQKAVETIIVNILGEYTKIKSTEMSTFEVIVEFYDNLSDYQKNLVISGTEEYVRKWLKTVVEHSSNEASILNITRMLTNLGIEDWNNQNCIEFEKIFYEGCTNLINLKEYSHINQETNILLEGSSSNESKLICSNTNKSIPITIKINNSPYKLNLPMNLDSFTIETKNLIDAMLDDIPLNKEQEIIILMKLIQDRLA